MQTITWQKRPARELVRLAWPIAVSMLSYALMTFVDTLFVGQLGSSALAGVSLGGTTAFGLICFGLGFLRAGKILTSQARGAQETWRYQHIFSNSVLQGILLGVLTMAAGIGLAMVLPLCAATQKAGTAAQHYLFIRNLSTPMVLLYAALREFRYGLGDSRSAMVAGVGANLLNITLDYILIVVCSLGVEGAAWATFSAHCVECLVLIFYKREYNYALQRPSRREIWAFIRLGAPQGVQFMLEMGSFIMVTILLSRLGDVELAAHQIGIQVVHFSFLPALALSDALSVMVGQAMGAAQRQLIRPLSHLALKIAGLYCALCALPMILGGSSIAGWFGKEVDLIVVTGSILTVAAMFQLFDAANVVARGTLQGCGDVRFAALVCIGLSWACIPTATYILGYRFGMGAVGAWLGLCLELLLSCAILWGRIRRRYAFT